MKSYIPLHAIFILGFVPDAGSQGLAAAENSGQPPCLQQIQQAAPNQQGRELQGRDAQGRDAQGRDAQGRDAQGRDAQGRDAQGRDAQGRDAQGRDAQGRDAQGRDAQGRDAQGRDAQGRDAQGRDAQGRDAQGRDAQGRDAQGRDAQGRDAQGRDAQGRDAQGTGLSVSMVKQISIKGTSVQDLRLEGTLLVGTLDGKRIAGTDFINAVITQQNPDGSRQEVTLEKVEADPRDTKCEVFLYTLTTKNSKTGAAENFCTPDPWKGQYATPVYGGWDTTGARQKSTKDFMFACTSGVIAKCIRWGYRPWKSDKFADYHQACTRMARADYCGDGVSHTEDGTIIDMYDSLGIQTQSPYDPELPMLFDAAWTPNGAYCVAKDRWIKLDAFPVALRCKARFVIPVEGFLKALTLLKKAKTLTPDILAPLEKSPIDSQDVCMAKREGWSSSEVLIDNRSGINVKRR